jgi:hypothetical protein
MLNNIYNTSLIQRILLIKEELGTGIDFHKKTHELLPEFSSLKYVSKVFEKNLNDSLFLDKKWNSYEIPHLTIYEDKNITIRYHLFFPVQTLNNHNAAYLIHHHGNNILSSYILHGPGYQTIEFEKEILMLSDNSFKLKIAKDFFHSNGSINLLEDWIPHLIFNVLTPTVSIALWTNSESSSDEQLRLNYTLKKERFYSISDDDFCEEASKDIRFEFDSERHIQAICYFIQQLGYCNRSFLSETLSKVKSNELWSKWLIKLENSEPIELPYFIDKINTMGENLSIEEIRSYCS